MPPSPLAGAVTVVTGGGRGIGRAIACSFGAAGAHVAICARTQGELDEAAQAVHQAGGGQVDVLAVRCDVASAESVEAFSHAVLERMGVPRVLVNNAGVAFRGRLDKQEMRDWYEVVDVNLFGTYLVTRAFLGPMRGARSGRIINVSSISGRLGTALHTAYCAAKHGVVGLTRALAEEVRGDGLQVNAICPGSVDTKMLEGSGFSPDMTPEDVARVARFLAEEAPDALTGACLDVFG